MDQVTRVSVFGPLSERSTSRKEPNHVETTFLLLPSDTFPARVYNYFFIAWHGKRGGRDLCTRFKKVLLITMRTPSFPNVLPWLLPSFQDRPLIATLC